MHVYRKFLSSGNLNSWRNLAIDFGDDWQQPSRDANIFPTGRDAYLRDKHLSLRLVAIYILRFISEQLDQNSVHCIKQVVGVMGNQFYPCYAGKLYGKDDMEKDAPVE